MISINGVDLPIPTSFKNPQMDLDSGDTNRNEQGFLQRDRIRQGIYKLELEWTGITNQALQTILQAIEPASIQVAFPSVLGTSTKTMYAGDRSIEMSRYYNKNDIRWNIKFNLTEY